MRKRIVVKKVALGLSAFALLAGVALGGNYVVKSKFANANVATENGAENDDSEEIEYIELTEAVIDAMEDDESSEVVAEEIVAETEEELEDLRENLYQRTKDGVLSEEEVAKTILTQDIYRYDKSKVDMTIDSIVKAGLPYSSSVASFVAMCSQSDALNGKTELEVYKELLLKCDLQNAKYVNHGSLFHWVEPNCNTMWKAYEKYAKKMKKSLWINKTTSPSFQKIEKAVKNGGAIVEVYSKNAGSETYNVVGVAEGIADGRMAEYMVVENRMYPGELFYVDIASEDIASHYFESIRFVDK